MKEKETENVIEKWIHCKFDDDLTVNTESKWDRLYLVLNETGTLKLFGDDTTDSVKGKFDLTLWTLQQIEETETATEFGTFTVSLKSKEGDIRFVFETEVERRGMVNAMKQFIGDENGDLVENKEMEHSQGMLFGIEFKGNITMLFGH